MNGNREYKSDVFSMLMEDAANALEVYNALNGSEYADPEEVEMIRLEKELPDIRGTAAERCRPLPKKYLFWRNDYATLEMSIELSFITFQNCKNSYTDLSEISCLKINEDNKKAGDFGRDEEVLTVRFSCGNCIRAEKTAGIRQECPEMPGMFCVRFRSGFRYPFHFPSKRMRKEKGETDYGRGMERMRADARGAGELRKGCGCRAASACEPQLQGYGLPYAV